MCVGDASYVSVVVILIPYKQGHSQDLVSGGRGGGSGTNPKIIRVPLVILHGVR